MLLYKVLFDTDQVHVMINRSQRHESKSDICASDHYTVALLEEVFETANPP